MVTEPSGWVTLCRVGILWGCPAGAGGQKTWPLLETSRQRGQILASAFFPPSNLLPEPLAEPSWNSQSTLPAGVGPDDTGQSKGRRRHLSGEETKLRHMSYLPPNMHFKPLKSRGHISLAFVTTVASTKKILINIQ